MYVYMNKQIDIYTYKELFSMGAVPNHMARDARQKIAPAGGGAHTYEKECTSINTHTHTHTYTHIYMYIGLTRAQPATCTYSRIVRLTMLAWLCSHSHWGDTCE